MITLTDDKLTIEIEHVCPGDLVNELSESLIFVLQHVDYDDSVDGVKRREANYFLLLLLREMMEVKG